MPEVDGRRAQARSGVGVGSLLFMLRIIAARNGTIEPSVALKIDTLGDAATARRAFIDDV